jgi:hypothetical protein
VSHQSPANRPPLYAQAFTPLLCCRSIPGTPTATGRHPVSIWASFRSSHLVPSQQNEPLLGSRRRAMVAAGVQHRRADNAAAHIRPSPRKATPCPMKCPLEVVVKRLVVHVAPSSLFRLMWRLQYWFTEHRSALCIGATGARILRIRNHTAATSRPRTRHSFSNTNGHNPHRDYSRCRVLLKPYRGAHYAPPVEVLST